MTRRNSRLSGSASATWRVPLLSTFLVLFLVGGLLAGYLFYSTVKDLVAHAELGAPILANNDQGDENPLIVPDVRLQRTNILLLGIDKRSVEIGPSRTDTMIVLTVNPADKAAGMLSIPRDLWVSIPGHAEGRINTAHFIGDASNYPGGGPALAKLTVQYAIGVPIHYYIRINFEGFERLIDAVGGITIDVQEPIHDEKYPDGSFGYMTVDIPAGVQHMDGKTALQYARSRHGGSDFIRARRQQEVIKAIRDKVLHLGIPLTKIPEMLRIAGDSVQTDLSLTQIYELAKLALDIPGDGLTNAVIDESMTTPQTTPEGAQVLIPNRALIRQAVDDLFGTGIANSPTSLSTQQILAQEAARIEVQNGTLTVGLAQSTLEELKEAGYSAVVYSNADRSDYASTIIISYSIKPQTVSLLAERFKVSADNIRTDPMSRGDVDIRLILGADYASTVLP